MSHLSPLPWPRWAEVAAGLGAWALALAVALVGRALSPSLPFSGHTVGVTLAEAWPWLGVAPLVFALARRWPLLGADRRTPRPAVALALHLALAAVAVGAVGTAQQAGLAAMGPPPALAATPPERPPPGEPSRAAGRPVDLWTPSLNGLLYLALLGVGMARAAAIQGAARRAQAERAEAERARLAAQVTEARLDALRMQLRPHFLFNALNAVSALAADDPAEARRVVARLSSLLRRVLEADARPLVPLRDEIDFARDYLDLQRVRFERLDAVEDIDPALLDVEVPTLVLQPLVENSVEHGAAGGRGRVGLRAAREGDRLLLAVSDDGPGLGGHPDPDIGPGIGLSNVRGRLAALYGEAATLSLRERPGGGAEAVISLPLADD